MLLELSETQHFWISDRTELGALFLPICPELRIRRLVSSLCPPDLQHKGSKFGEAE